MTKTVEIEYSFEYQMQGELTNRDPGDLYGSAVSACGRISRKAESSLAALDLSMTARVKKRRLDHSIIVKTTNQPTNQPTN